MRACSQKIKDLISPAANLRGQHQRVERDALLERVNSVAHAVGQQLSAGDAVGILSENSLDWVIADLGLQCLPLTVIPIPGFFTATQILHLLESRNIKAILAPRGHHLALLKEWRLTTQIAGLDTLGLYLSPESAASGHTTSKYQKVTFTSGSTAQPKGICLTADQQWAVAKSLQSALEPQRLVRHLVMLPLSVLLENLAGVYTGLLMGAEVVVFPLSETGLSGSSAFDASKAIALIRSSETQSVILLPQMLKDITTHLESSADSLPNLRFIAVGGGKVPPTLIQRARAIGLPVYEGYGLSETASVVALNLPHGDLVGSVGQPLPHLRVTIANDGEILISTSQEWAQQHHLDLPTETVASGDLGQLDSDGFLHVTGRKKNQLITSFGRNVSPEWPEALLISCDAIAQAFVYGESRSKLAALIVPQDPDTAREVIAQAVDKANLQLPDYAQIDSWHVLEEPFSPANGMLTLNGRMKRDAITSRYLSSDPMTRT